MALNLVGQRFGKLLIIKKDTERTKEGGLIWTCACDCGKKKSVSTKNLQQGRTKSCGCLIEKDRNKLYSYLRIKLKGNNVK